MGWISRSGELEFLRVDEPGGIYGPPNDAIHTEVTASIKNDDIGFGFTLRTGDGNLPSQFGMLAVLRDALLHKRKVTVWLELPEGKKNGRLRRVQI